MAHVYVAEDDPGMRRELENLLVHNGHTCTLPEQFTDLAYTIAASGCDIVLLDLGLPELDGLAVLRTLRSRSDVPVIILTSRESDADELTGMHYGADDYVTKPFNPLILIARIESVLRRSSKSAASHELHGRGLTLDLARGVCAGPEACVELTKNEQGILTILMRRHGEIVSRDEIMEALWQSSAFIDDNTLTVNIARLRSKLAEAGCPGVIRTRRGMGYQF